MKKSIIFAILIILVMTVGCAGTKRFQSNVHSGNVPEWAVPASLSPAFEKDGEMIAVGFVSRMHNVNKQRAEAAQIAISKIMNKNLEARVTDVFTDDNGNIFVVAKQK